jgi:hypothetical protein
MSLEPVDFSTKHITSRWLFPNRVSLVIRPIMGRDSLYLGTARDVFIDGWFTLVPCR